ncbi:unnamed protein product, partial [Allacma fusca]
IFPSSYKNPTPGSNQSRNYRERATTHRCGAEDHTTQHQVKRRLSVLRILFKTSILVVCIHRTWDVCRYEYSRQTTAFVKMPPTPEGWTACQVCEMVFVQDGQRFCALFQYRTPAGTNYGRTHSAHLR